MTGRTPCGQRSRAGVSSTVKGMGRGGAITAAAPTEREQQKQSGTQNDAHGSPEPAPPPALIEASAATAVFGISQSASPTTSERMTASSSVATRRSASAPRRDRQLTSRFIPKQDSTDGIDAGCEPAGRLSSHATATDGEPAWAEVNGRGGGWRLVP